MNMKERPTIIKEKQAAAAVGQAMLMQIYQNFFNQYNQTVAQVLLTKEELSSAIATSGKFMRADHVITDCMTALDIIPMFLDYYNTLK